MRRNPHVRFLGGREVATLPAYPTFFPTTRLGRLWGRERHVGDRKVRRGHQNATRAPCGRPGAECASGGYASCSIGYT